MFARLAPRDHACLTYDDPQELRSLLDRFTTDGLDAERLTLFVHAFEDDAEALRFLDEGAVDYRSLVGKSFFLVNHHEAAFQGGAPRIDHEHVARVVTELEARAKGAPGGLGIFVDASRRYLDEGRHEEWFTFEEWLGTRLQHDVGLVCAYRKPDVEDPATRARMLRAHLYRFG